MFEALLCRGVTAPSLSGDTWKAMTFMSTGLARGMMAGVGDKIYAIDGWGGTSNYSSIRTYTISTNSWLSVSRSGGGSASRSGSAVSVGSDIYVFGGYTTTRLNTLWKFDTVANTWTARATGPAARTGAGMTAAGGKVYIFGGDVNVGGDWMKDLWAYDIATNTWAQLAGGPVGRYDAAMAAIGTKLYLYGGNPYSGPKLKDLWCYDTLANTWTQLASNTVSLTTTGLVAIDGKLYMSGGSDMWCYDPDLDTWTQKAVGVTPPTSPSTRQDQMMTAIGGQVYVLGGVLSSVYKTELYRYTP